MHLRYNTQNFITESALFITGNRLFCVLQIKVILVPPFVVADIADSDKQVTK